MGTQGACRGSFAHGIRAYLLFGLFWLFMGFIIGDLERRSDPTWYWILTAFLWWNMWLVVACALYYRTRCFKWNCNRIQEAMSEPM